MEFHESLKKRIQKANSLLVVGLDTDNARLPNKFKGSKNPQFEFNKWIIDQTHPYVCAYKPNTAFYEAQGAQGIAQLQQTCQYSKERHPDIPIIIDAKRADIDNTNKGYKSFIFEYLDADAVTINPYLGLNAIAPFFQTKSKGVFVLVKTSNPGSAQFQNRMQDGTALWVDILHQLLPLYDKNNNIGIVVGATKPQELSHARDLVGDMCILAPGVGTQGANLKQTLALGGTKGKGGILVSMSRSIIFNMDPGVIAKNVQRQMKSYRNTTVSTGI